MNDVIYVEFHKQAKRKLPRKRVFYLGQYYAGPLLCQSLEKLWLKRKPNNRGVFQQKIYGVVFEYEEYHGNDLLDALDAVPLVDEVTMDDLLEMGWRHQDEVIQYA